MTALDMSGSLPSPVAPRTLMAIEIVGVSNPESMELSDDDEFKGRLIGSSMCGTL